MTLARRTEPTITTDNHDEFVCGLRKNDWRWMAKHHIFPIGWSMHSWLHAKERAVTTENIAILKETRFLTDKPFVFNGLKNVTSGTPQLRCSHYATPVRRYGLPQPLLNTIECFDYLALLSGDCVVVPLLEINETTLVPDTPRMVKDFLPPEFNKKREYTALTAAFNDNTWQENVKAFITFKI